MVVLFGCGCDGGGGGGGGYDIGGAADVRSACVAVIVEITTGKGARAILTTFLLPLRVAIVALPFAIKLVRFEPLFALFVSLWGERERKSCQRVSEEGIG